MNQNLALRRLVWKEVRQIQPLVVLLFVLGLLLHTLVLLSGSDWRGNFQYAQVQHFYVFLGLPGLFAVGVGALLVSQEKEQRTMFWLASLPISPHRIVMTKLLISLGALAVVWTLSGLALSTFKVQGESLWLNRDFGSFASWVMNSIFVLLAGTALAWKLNSSFASLACVVPVAVLPLLAANVLASNDARLPLFAIDPSPASLLVTQLLLSALAIGLAWRFGLQSLSAARVPAITKPARPEDLKHANTWNFGPLLAPQSALVWQFTRQSRVLLVALLAGLFLGTWFFVIGKFYRGTDLVVIWAAILALLAIIWLGVCSFQGDRLHNRIRFLADRGVRPRTVWWTRHLAPLGMIAIVGTAWMVFSGTVMVGSISLLLSFDPIVPISLICFAIVAYCFAQWVGQVTTSPIVAAVTSPIVVVAALFYLSNTIMLLGTPVWLLVLCLPIPLIATYGAMNLWMDGQIGIRFWLWHAGLLCAWLLIPAIPFLAVVSTIDSMPASIATEIATFRSPSPSLPARVNVDSTVVTPPSQHYVGLAEHWKVLQSDVSKYVHGPREGLLLERIQRLIPFAILFRTNLQVPEEKSEHLQRYQQSIELLTDLVRRCRASSRLLDQDFADVVECFLVKELLLPNARQTLGATFETTARQLADRDSRAIARQRAIAAGWQQYQQQYYSRRPAERSVDSFGGYTIGGLNRKAGSFENLVARQRRFGRAVADLWELAKLREQGATDERLRKIADYWGYTRFNDTTPFVLPTPIIPRVPGRLWFASWESQAAKLVTDPQ